MLKKFQNSYTKYTNPKTQITFKIGDEVLGAGNVRGKIVALSAGADFLLDTGDIIPYGRKIVHAPKPAAEPEKLFESPQKTAKKSSTPRASSKENCETENKRLRRELEECTSRTLPKVVENAPAEVQPKLPEVRQESIVQDMRVSANNIIVAAQSGDKAVVRAEEKKITEAVKELKEVAPLQTMSASENCRVIRSDMAGKPTIHIYFEHKVSEETKTLLLRNNFMLRFEMVNKKKEWSWRAYFSEERLKFAMGFCKVKSDSPSPAKNAQRKPAKSEDVPSPSEMASLMGAERVAAIRKSLTTIFPEIKFYIVKTSYHACSIYIASAPYDFKRSSYDNKGKAKIVFDDIKEIANRGVKYHETADYGDQPDFYVSIILGHNGVPFKYTGVPEVEKPKEEIPKTWIKLEPPQQVARPVVEPKPISNELRRLYREYSSLHDTIGRLPEYPTIGLFRDGLFKQYNEMNDRNYPTFESFVDKLWLKNLRDTAKMKQEREKPEPLPTPDEPEDDGDNELKELMAMMKAALQSKTN